MADGKYGGSAGEEWLRAAYHDKGMTISMIAELDGVSETTVLYWMDKYGIDRRGPDGIADDDAPWRDGEVMRRLYVEGGLSQKAVADELGCSTPTVRNWLRRHGIEIRRPDHSSEGGRQNQAMWSEARSRVLLRDGGECQDCGSGSDLVVHHRVPVSEGGDLYAPSNLMTLCERCHFERHWN